MKSLILFLTKEVFKMIKELEKLASKINDKEIRKEILKISKDIEDRHILKLNKKELEELISDKVEYEDELGNISVDITA